MATQTAAKTIPSQMRACQIVEYHKPFQIRTIPTPTKDDLPPDYILLKVAVCGLCHTDLEYLKGFVPLQLPVTASHEGTGTVVALGSNVTNFKIGDRVLAGQTFGRCGECDICRGPEEYRHFCKKRDCMMTIDGRNGAFQEYLAVDAREAVLLPDKMSFATATPLACAGMTAWRAVKQTRLQPGQWVAIVGSGGGLGHLAIQFARKVWKLKVVGVDARDAGLDMSREAGADLVVDARKGKEAMAEEVLKATAGQGCDAAIELSGHPTAIENGVAMTKQHGQVIQVAAAGNVYVSARELMIRDIRLTGSFMASRQETEDMLNAFIEYGIHLENNVFKGLEEIPRVADMATNFQYRGKACFIIDADAEGLEPGNGRV